MTLSSSLTKTTSVLWVLSYLLRHTKRHACCGHHISQQAANRLIRERKPCPMCKEDNFDTHKDKFFKRNCINKLKVYCLHKKSGCVDGGTGRPEPPHYLLSKTSLEVPILWSWIDLRDRINWPHPQLCQLPPALFQPMWDLHCPSLPSW